MLEHLFYLVQLGNRSRKNVDDSKQSANGSDGLHRGIVGPVSSQYQGKGKMRSEHHNNSRRMMRLVGEECMNRKRCWTRVSKYSPWTSSCSALDVAVRTACCLQGLMYLYFQITPTYSPAMRITRQTLTLGILIALRVVGTNLYCRDP